MTLYGSALFVHVVFAILLVGGGIYTHVSLGLVPRAGTVDGIRSHAAWLHVFVKGTGPVAVVVLGSGVYMSFAGTWWGDGWPGVSLGLFAIGGVTATALIDPRVGRLRAALDDMPDGPVTSAMARSLVDPTLRRAGWLLVGADLAIVFLMTNKPGWTGSTVTAAIGLAAGAVAGVLTEQRTDRRTAPSPAGASEEESLA